MEFPFDAGGMPANLHFPPRATSGEKSGLKFIFYLSMHPLLLLWDIDGTLVESLGTGIEALSLALLNRFGVLDDLDGLEIAGRTDTAIGEELSGKHRNHGVEAAELLEAYLDQLVELLPKRTGKVCPGVREILDWCHAHPEAHNALLTGNVRRGATIKLGHFGLNDFFEFGAFGDDSADRNQLGPIVLERARARLKKDFHLRRTWIIGDTPRDVECARALGCRALAVATGPFTLDQLRACNPDLAFEDLSDHAAVIRHLSDLGT